MPDPVVPLDPDRLDAIEEEALRKRDEPDFSIVILKPDEAAALVTGVRDRDRLHRHEGILAIKLTTANQLRVKAEAERDALRAEVEAAAANFDADTGPEDVLALIEALRIAREALVDLDRCLYGSDDCASCRARRRMDALVAFTPDPQEASDADA